MHYAVIRSAAIAAALALSATLSLAADGKPEAPAQPTTKAKPVDDTKAKAAKRAPQRLVDINRAGKAELMKLPGVDEAVAAKIIAGRPYRSKADLVTRSVIPNGIYEDIKGKIMAKPQ